MKKKTKQALSIAAMSALIGMYICVLVLVTLNVASAEPYKGTYGTSYEERAIIQICEENRVAASVEPSRVYFDVPLDKDLQDHIMDICEERNIDPRVAFAMIKCESGFRAEATGDSGNSLGDVLAASDIVKEEKGLCAAADNVVDAHCHTVDANGIVLVLK